MDKKDLRKIFKEYPDVVDITQMRKMLDIGRNAAYRLLKEEKIEYFNIGKKFRILKISIIDFLNN